MNMKRSPSATAGPAVVRSAANPAKNGFIFVWIRKVGEEKMAMMNMDAASLRAHFMEPLPVVTTTISPIRAPSPCGECPTGIRRSGSCSDCLAPTSHPPTPRGMAVDDLELEFRRVLGNDTVDRINNPVGMALEDAAHREATDRLLQAGRAVHEAEVARERARNFYECEWCTSKDLAEGSVLCKKCDSLEFCDAEHCESGCGRQVNPAGYLVCRFCRDEARVEKALREMKEQRERERVRNNYECEWCPSKDLAEDSVLCKECDALEFYEAEHCDNGCGRQVKPVGYLSCRFCLIEEFKKQVEEKDELNWPLWDIEKMFRDNKHLDEYVPYHAYRVDRDRLILGPACDECLKYRAAGYKLTGYKRGRETGCVGCTSGGSGCLGCGMPGYDDDYCSRDCLISLCE